MLNQTSEISWTTTTLLWIRFKISNAIQHNSVNLLSVEADLQALPLKLQFTRKCIHQQHDHPITMFQMHDWFCNWQKTYHALYIYIYANMLWWMTQRLHQKTAHWKEIFHWTLISCIRGYSGLSALFSEFRKQRFSKPRQIKIFDQNLSRLSWLHHQVHVIRLNLTRKICIADASVDIMQV